MKNGKSIVITIMLCLTALLSVLWAGVSFADGLGVNGSFTVPDTVPPAAVRNLSVIGFATNSFTLTWTAPGDDGNVGNASQYDIRYSNSPITSESGWNTATQAVGVPAPKSVGSPETFVVSGLNPATFYYFALKTADGAPNWSSLSNCTGGTTLGGGGGGGGDGPSENLVLHVNLWDAMTVSGSISKDGVLLKSLKISSEDGIMTLYLIEGMSLRYANGRPVTQLTVSRVQSLPWLPGGYHLVMAFDFQPNGCIFAPAIVTTVKYDKSAIPEDIAEENLVVAHIDREEGVSLFPNALVDTDSSIVMFLVNSTSFYALLLPTSVPPYKVTPTPTVAPTPSPMATPPSSPTSTPTVAPTTPAATPSQSPTPTPTPVPAGALTTGLGPGAWTGTGVGVIAAVLLLLWLLLWRRRRK